MRLGVAFAFAITVAIIGFALGNSYIGRLPNHAGYWLVPVDDAVRVPIPRRSRHTVLVVVDGLRRDGAETLSATRTLLRAGQCRVSDQGSYTVSRPEYALLSTGLEADRTGARNNDLTAPLAAESIWQVARASGLRVGVSSHLPWFQQLFPDGFDELSLGQSHAVDVFTSELHDVDVIHPLYVDETAHQHGAASAEYRAAVARVDRELGALLARLDLTRDTVILTADHGHRDEGGHGGAQPEIKDVLACFAGPNIAHRDDRRSFDGRNTAPLLAVLLGVRFPRHMRAGDDALDELWEIARAEDDHQAYLADRRAAVAHFRDANRAALEGHLGGAPGSWPRLYAREAHKQHLRIAAITALALFLFAVRLRARRESRRSALTTAGWLVFVALSIWATHHVVLGDFDYTVINLKSRFVPRAFAVVFISSLVSIAAYRWLFRRAQLLLDQLTVLALLLVANVGHVLVYGWPLGFPLPPQPARYFPFFGAIALVGSALITMMLVLVMWRRSVRAARDRTA